MHSSWVAASAGTGKTRALVTRVLLLLATGNKGILCLTFTRSAAAEMLKRVSQELMSWVMLPDQELKDKLNQLIKHDHNINYARSLFNRLSELLTIKTIHSFCYELISELSQKSHIAYNAKILDYKDHIYNQAINVFLSRNPDLGEIGLDISRNNLLDIFAELSPVTKNHTMHSIYLKRLESSLVAPDEIANTDIINIMMQGNARDIKHAILLQHNVRKALLKINGDKKKISSIITKSLLNTFPDVETLILNIQDNCYLRDNIHNKLIVIKRTISILDIVSQIYSIFNELKKEYITYDEVIEIALKLLKDQYDLVMLSLSNSVQHILVDEAQDNSKEQWELICLLSDDFFSGIGVNHTQRTIFVVGDAKQSIYSFQGANPELFCAMQSYFSYKSELFNQKMILKTLNISYRSSQNIIKLIDTLFAQQTLNKALSVTNDEIKHICARKDVVGHTELWPLVQKTGDEDLHLIKNEKLILAQNIVNKILNLIGKKNISTGEKITADNIMILVRRRDAFVHYMIAELRKNNLEITGYDRFNITDHIIIKDLISLGKVLLVADNDFELVKVLKSPLFRLTEDEIFTLSYNRKNHTIWERLREYHPGVFDKIKTWRNKMNNSFEIYYNIINQENFAREYQNIIDKFLKLALEKPILTDFLQLIECNKIEVKNSQTDGIKVMTVHNAKGLESPIVFLADTTEIPYNRNYITFNEDNIPLYIKNNVFDDVKAQTNKLIYEEYIRLLYVALTRARDQLYITGCGNSKEGSWYDLISSVATEEMRNKM